MRQRPEAGPKSMPWVRAMHQEDFLAPVSIDMCTCGLGFIIVLYEWMKVWSVCCKMDGLGFSETFLLESWKTTMLCFCMWFVLKNGIKNVSMFFYCRGMFLFLFVSLNSVLVWYVIHGIITLWCLPNVLTWTPKQGRKCEYLELTIVNFHYWCLFWA